MSREQALVTSAGAIFNTIACPQHSHQGFKWTISIYRTFRHSILSIGIQLDSSCRQKFLLKSTKTSNNEVLSKACICVKIFGTNAFLSPVTLPTPVI